METSGRFTSCCVALFFALTSVSAVQKKLDSINDLKKINFGQSVPKHSLLLLHWLANAVHIDDNDIITLTFDPSSGDYTSHYYGNSEGLLDPLPWENGYRYYSIGNIYQRTSVPLPPYVVHPRPECDDGRNRDRIIIRVMEQNTGGQALQRIDQVYLTQHYGTSEHQGTRYDPAHTYRITADLLRDIGEFFVGENAQSLQYLINVSGSNADVSQIRNTWGNLACLGLLLFIVIKEKNSSIRHNIRKNKDVAVDIGDDEDHKASRESGSYHTSVPDDHEEWLNYCCPFIFFILLLFIVVYFYFSWYKIT